MKPGNLQKVRVKCTIYIDVELSADEDAKFVIEDNGCPGTGLVGAALLRAIEKSEETNICWACLMKGKNEIVRKITKTQNEDGNENEIEARDPGGADQRAKGVEAKRTQDPKLAR